jgi:predicted lipid-binding transport protein (Tim44 family)
MIKKVLSTLVLAISVASLGLTTLDAEAKRLGGGRPAGMQRQAPTQPANNTATPQQQAPKQATAPSPATPAAAQAAPPKRSWLGPIAGLAAGLGIAALMSHFGMGEALGNFLTMALLAMVALFAIRWVMGRMRGAAPAGPQLAGAGAPVGANGWQGSPEASNVTPLQREALAPAAGLTGAAATAALGTDAASFERIAKMIFVRMQAANDTADLEDLRKFTTPELFASLRLDLQERGSAQNQTDVVQLNAAVVDTAQEGVQQIVSVRFDGLIREDLGGAANPFAEIWHLVRPLDGSRDWAIAGIAPIQ